LFCFISYCVNVIIWNRSGHDTLKWQTDRCLVGAVYAVRSVWRDAEVKVCLGQYTGHNNELFAKKGNEMGCSDNNSLSRESVLLPVMEHKQRTTALDVVVTAIWVSPSSGTCLCYKALLMQKPGLVCRLRLCVSH
jgi:hypothetical protein